MRDTAISAGRGLPLIREAIPLMANFDERAIRSPTDPVETIRPGDVRPWMVWAAAGAIGVLAVTGLYLGLRSGHPVDGGGLTLARGAVLNPATAASATPAVALPKDQQWSALSGPEIRPKSATAPKTAATDQSDSGAEDSAEPAAAAVADEPEAPAAQPAVQPAAPAPPTDQPAADGQTP